MSPAKKGKTTKSKSHDEASVATTGVSNIVEKSKMGGKAGNKETANKMAKSTEEISTKNGSVDGEKNEHVVKGKSVEDEDSVNSNAAESKETISESADGSKADEKVIDDDASKAGKKAPTKKAAAKKATDSKKQVIEEKMDVENDAIECDKVVDGEEKKTDGNEEIKEVEKAEKVEETEKPENSKKTGRKAPVKKGGKKDQENKQESDEIMDVDKDVEIHSNNVEETQKADEQAAKTSELAVTKVAKKSAPSKKGVDNKKEDVDEKMDVDDEEKEEKVEDTKPVRGSRRGANAANKAVVKDDTVEAEKSTRSTRRNASEKVEEKTKKVEEKAKVTKKAANAKETKKTEVKAASAKSEEKKTDKNEGASVMENSGNNKDGSRKRKPAAKEAEVSQAKKPKLLYDVPSVPVTSTVKGSTVAWGDGDMGQLGLGPDVYDMCMPKVLDLGDDSKKVVQVFAGGLHSLVLTSNGEIYSFGCNDESPLGRVTEEEENCFTPQKVVGIEGKIVQIAGGDNHSIALDDEGRVYIWGTFRDNEGLIGMTPEEEAGRKEAKKDKKKDDDEDKPMGKYNKIEKPLRILREVKVVKIATGFAHILCLSDRGEVYSLGVSETGQLGRSSEYFSRRGGRRGVDDWLTAKPVRFRKRSLKIVDIWAGGRASFAKSVDGEIYAWGLNNYVQLGFSDMANRFVPEVVPTFTPALDWKVISCNGNHTLALDAAGKVYVLGCKDNGRLGLGNENLQEVKELTPIKSLEGKKVVSISAGPAVSFAVEEDGALYCWGAGSCKQLAQGEDAEDDIYVPTLIAGKLKNMKVTTVSAGGTHVLALACSKN